MSPYLTGAPTGNPTSPAQVAHKGRTADLDPKGNCFTKQASTAEDIDPSKVQTSEAEKTPTMMADIRRTRDDMNMFSLQDLAYDHLLGAGSRSTTYSGFGIGASFPTNGTSDREYDHTRNKVPVQTIDRQLVQDLVHPVFSSTNNSITPTSRDLRCPYAYSRDSNEDNAQENCFAALYSNSDEGLSNLMLEQQPFVMPSSHSMSHGSAATSAEISTPTTARAINASPIFQQGVSNFGSRASSFSTENGSVRAINKSSSKTTQYSDPPQLENGALYVPEKSKTNSNSGPQLPIDKQQITSPHPEDKQFTVERSVVLNTPSKPLHQRNSISTGGKRKRARGRPRKNPISNPMSSQDTSYSKMIGRGDDQEAEKSRATKATQSQIRGTAADRAVRHARRLRNSSSKIGDVHDDLLKLDNNELPALHNERAKLAMSSDYASEVSHQGGNSEQPTMKPHKAYMENNAKYTDSKRSKSDHRREFAEELRMLSLNSGSLVTYEYDPSPDLEPKFNRALYALKNIFHGASTTEWPPMSSHVKPAVLFFRDRGQNCVKQSDSLNLRSKKESMYNRWMDITDLTLYNQVLHSRSSVGTERLGTGRKCEEVSREHHADGESKDKVADDGLLLGHLKINFSNPIWYEALRVRPSREIFYRAETTPAVIEAPNNMADLEFFLVSGLIETMKPGKEAVLLHTGVLGGALRALKFRPGMVVQMLLLVIIRMAVSCYDEKENLEFVAARIHSFLLEILCTAKVHFDVVVNRHSFSDSRSYDIFLKSAWRAHWIPIQTTSVERSPTFRPFTQAIQDALHSGEPLFMGQEKNYYERGPIPLMPEFHKTLTTHDLAIEIFIDTAKLTTMFGHKLFQSNTQRWGKYLDLRIRRDGPTLRNVQLNIVLHKYHGSLVRKMASAFTLGIPCFRYVLWALDTLIDQDFVGNKRSQNINVRPFFLVECVKMIGYMLLRARLDKGKTSSEIGKMFFNFAMQENAAHALVRYVLVGPKLDDDPLYLDLYDQVWWLLHRMQFTFPYQMLTLVNMAQDAHIHPHCSGNAAMHIATSFIFSGQPSLSVIERKNILETLAVFSLSSKSTKMKEHISDVILRLCRV